MKPSKLMRRCGMAALAALLAPAAQGQGLVEVGKSVGLDYEFVNGMTGELYFSEMMGPGGALFDFDGDGDLDVFVVQGHPLGPGVATEAPPLAHRDRLYRNDLEILPGGERRIRLVDVTAASGIEAKRAGYGYGVATGDYDNDGRVDLYVTNWGENVLWRNLGDGRFEDATARSGVADGGWGTSATFFDMDRDGDLDLFVANYVRYSYENDKPCFAPSSARDYCGPLSYPAGPDRLFRNRGDGTFETVSLDPGGQGFGAALGAIAADFDGDGWTDLFVCNDGTENHLWMNRQGKGFVNQAVLAGVAVNLEGRAEASMGVDVADYDGDGDFDLFLTHLNGETNTLYRNDGAGFFDDRTAASGLGPPSWGMTSFGTAFFDLDNDNRLDLFVANGAVKRLASQVAQGEKLPLRQRNQLFRQVTDGRFEEVEGTTAEGFRATEVSRGAAFGDLDNDGDADILVLNNSGPSRVLLNRTPRVLPSWLGLRLVGGPEGRERDQVGATVEIGLADGTKLVRRARADGSYASANDPRVLVALPSAKALREIIVRWPDGRRERFAPPEQIDRYLDLRRGRGEAQ